MSRDSGTLPQTKIFEVKEGEGFLGISHRLEAEGVIRSELAFETLSFFTGAAIHFKPGIYQFDSTKNGLEILRELTFGPHREISVRIPEGASVYEVDSILSEAGVVPPRELLAYVKAQSRPIEGRLFPDTYKFFTGSPPKDIIEKFLENFRAKTEGFFDKLSEAKINEIITLASIIQKEVPGEEDGRIVAGILLKRLKAGVPLQVDASICYIKKILGYPGDSPCYPLHPLDFKTESDYNTYLRKGLPPGPIGNPGISALRAALSPKSSSYWYYLSDPETQRTVFASTLEEHNENRAMYLGL
ncbi:MAG: endolytic transglycosylase MltG [Patescibacteria group bacterium]